MMTDTFDVLETRRQIDILVEETERIAIAGQLPRRWITSRVIREKQPHANLKLGYRRTIWGCIAVTFALHVAVAAAFPTFAFRRPAPPAIQSVITMEEIPETRQVERPPPPPRPAVPVETESVDVPDDVTIESTDLDFDDGMFDLPPPPPPASRDGLADIEDEVVEFWAVSEPPVVIHEVFPVYPEVARKAGLEGIVFVQFVVGRDGKVKQVSVLKGAEMFRKAAVEAVQQFRFRPAVQNDNPVQVRMTRPIRFRLADGG